MASVGYTVNTTSDSVPRELYESAMLTPTIDPDIWIEEQRSGFVRYRASNGRRWEVHGTCDHRGDCMIGSTLADGTLIEDHDHLQVLVAKGRFPESELDTPVTPEFNTCCGSDLFTYVELEASTV
jgi:hypothetical protein